AAVVPDDDVPLAPPVAVLALGLDHPAGQLVDQRVALLLLEALDLENFAGVEVERLAPGLGMSANDGMPDGNPVAVLGVEQRRRLPPAAVGEDALASVEPVLELLRQRLVRRVHARIGRAHVYTAVAHFTSIQ